MNANSDYQVIYGVNLLDDLHNYFPELLYNHGRFNSVQSVFYYIRQRIHSRFNLYSYGAQQYNPSAQRPPPSPSPSPFASRASPFASPFIPSRQGQGQGEDILGNLNAASILLSFLGGGLGTAQGQEVRAGWEQPVLVRPSSQVIDRNTTLVTGVSGQRCAICQDEIRETEGCRRLNACTHVFHRTCIDLWFERSVCCPQCRHDIREPPAA